VRILLITQWFDPEPTPKGMSFARELARRGHDVEVLTGFPNYPGGKLYPGFRVRLLQREVRDGVRITRVPLYPSHGQSGIGRALNYLSFAFCALVYALFGARRPDVVYAYHPPLTVGIVGALVRTLRSVPVVLDVQDLWPDTLKATGMFSSERLLRIIGTVCRWVYRHVDVVVVLSPGFRRALGERGVPAERVRLIYNWCDEASLATPTAALPARFPTRDRFRVVFAGNLGKAQALDALLDAAALLRTRAPSVSLVFVGGGVEAARLEQAARARELTNVSFIPQVPMSEVGGVLREAEALIVHLRNDPLFSITIPSKTQAYMAVGRPLVMAVAGDAADLVRRSGCGVIAEPENAVSIANAIAELSESDATRLAAMAAAGQKFYMEHLSLRVGVGGFLEIFERLKPQVHP
jgi:glycosyltransferase involved in cell wall biosynthesis